jgi:hypothetical protein
MASCAICFYDYDRTSHRPKCFPCGHTICVDCLTDLSMPLTCPFDREQINIPKDKIPDNYTVIDMLKPEPIEKKIYAQNIFMKFGSKTIQTPWMVSNRIDNPIDVSKQTVSLSFLGYEKDLQLSEFKKHIESFDDMASDIASKNMELWLKSRKRPFKFTRSFTDEQLSITCELTDSTVFTTTKGAIIPVEARDSYFKPGSRVRAQIQIAKYWNKNGHIGM